MSRDVAIEMRRKRGGGAEPKATADVVNEKATTDSLRRGEERERDGRGAAEDDVRWPKMLVGRERGTETGPVAGSLLLPGYGASCGIRNESF